MKPKIRIRGMRALRVDVQAQHSDAPLALQWRKGLPHSELESWGRGVVHDRETRYYLMVYDGFASPAQRAHTAQLRVVQTADAMREEPLRPRP